MIHDDARDLERRNQELSILNTLAQALNRSVSLDAALQTTLAQVANLFGLETGWIWLIHEETEQSYLAAAQNLPPALAENPASMTGSCYCLDTFRAGDLEGAANVNVVTCSRLKNLIRGTRGLRYHASIPLYARDGSQLGILNVASQDFRQLSEDELQMLYTVGDLLAITVERARLFDRSVALGAVKERNRLAREIHDTLAQTLSGLTLQLETLDALIEADADREKLQPVVQCALASARSGLEEARRSVMDLRAAPLEGRTLGEALQALAQEYAQRNPFQVAFEGVDATRPLPARVEAGLFRIAQEALTNIAKHARARAVHLQLTVTPRAVALTIHDDGCGFDADQIDETSRYGLKGMGERARLLGGTMGIETCPGEGTTLRVEVPLDE